MRSVYTPPLETCMPAADNGQMSAAAVAVPRDVKSFRLAKPVAAEFTVCTFLSLAAFGVWLFVLPLELLRLVSA